VNEEKPAAGPAGFFSPVRHLTDTRPARAALLAALALAFATVAAGCFGGGKSSSATVTVTTTSTVASAPSGGGPADSLQRQFVRVVDDVSPSVVQIETPQGLGSGVVYDGKGDIVTNAHVVGTARSVKVTLSNGARHSGTVVGTFPPNDVAVVHVDGATPPAATFRERTPISVGDIVLAIGNPLGLRSSVTQGIVSSLGRTVSEGNGIALPSVIQTSAAINPGNSGGALVDLRSEVIGIPTLAALDPEFGSTPAAGIGFAIPSGTVRRIADQLIATGKVTQSGRAFLGVQVATLLNGGVLVSSVEPGSPADRAGLKAQDIIVAVAGTPVQSTDDLATALAQVKPGQTIPVKVSRNGTTLTLHVKVGELKSP
jgi:S1-C subfamily serine protease